MRRAGVLLLVVAGMATACASTVLYSHAASGMFSSDYFDEPERSVAVDYRGSGSCRGLGFSFIEDPENAYDSSSLAVVDTPTVTSTAPHVSGTWKLALRPGRYQLRGGTEGCEWSVTVRFLAPTEARPQYGH